MPYESAGRVFVRLAGDEHHLLPSHSKSHLGKQGTIQVNRCFLDLTGG
jgi:hypothetical protein